MFSSIAGQTPGTAIFLGFTKCFHTLPNAPVRQHFVSVARSAGNECSTLIFFPHFWIIVWNKHFRLMDAPSPPSALQNVICLCSAVIYIVVPKCAFWGSLKIFSLSLLVRVYLDVVFLLVWFTVLLDEKGDIFTKFWIYSAMISSNIWLPQQIFCHSLNYRLDQLIVSKRFESLFNFLKKLFNFQYNCYISLFKFTNPFIYDLKYIIQTHPVISLHYRYSVFQF